MAEPRDDKTIDAVAARWVARCDRGQLSPEEQPQLDAWLAADRRHFGAWARANAIYAHFDRARALAGGFEAEKLRSHRRDTHIQLNRGRRRFLWLGGAAAAGVAGFAFLRWPSEHHFETRLGEVLRVPLADGSSVTLNSDSAIAVRFSEARRLVQLQRGEALFDVAKDAARPFVVDAALASVTAVGTSFTVQRLRDDGGVKVIVREGVVMFASALAGATAGPVRLPADTLAVADIRDHVRVQPLEPVDVRRRLSWQDGMLSFDGVTLAQAAAEFARYSRTRIVLRDPAVADRRVVGRYSATDPAGFAKSVALGMHLHFERHGNSVYLALPSDHASR